jgi:hypothetical protein
MTSKLHVQCVGNIHHGTLFCNLQGQMGEINWVMMDMEENQLYRL